MQTPLILKTTRQKAFMIQKALAKESGVTVSTINRWERRKEKPDLTAMKNLKQFCKKNRLLYESIETAWFNVQSKI